MARKTFDFLHPHVFPGTPKYKGCSAMGAARTQWPVKGLLNSSLREQNLKAGDCTCVGASLPGHEYRTNLQLASKMIERKKPGS
jgi:hypothetical protein